jgi:hypothetical protein
MASNGFGVTTSVDMGAFTIPGTPDMKDAAQADNVESLNPWTMYDAFLALHREGKLTHRLRIFFLTQDTRPDVPILRERLNNAFLDFGDDMMKTSGIGEFGGVEFSSGTARRYERPQLIAQKGWAFQQHTLSLNEDKFTTDTFEKVNQVTPIANLRWSIAHAPQIDVPTLARLKAIGAGVAVHGWLYLGGSPGRGGPPYRTIVDSGVHVGAGSDAAAVSVFDRLDLLHGHREEFGGRLIRPATDADGGLAPLHRRERLVHPRRSTARHDRSRQARRPGGAERGLLRSGARRR